jgi:beta-glucosidase-like glycosyl hydrolase
MARTKRVVQIDSDSSSEDEAPVDHVVPPSEEAPEESPVEAIEKPRKTFQFTEERREALAKARQRALELRAELKKTQAPVVKPKKLTKLELELENAKLKEQPPPKVELPPPDPPAPASNAEQPSAPTVDAPPAQEAPARVRGFEQRHGLFYI